MMGERGRATTGSTGTTGTKTRPPRRNATARLSNTSLKASASACGLPKNLSKVGAISDQRAVQRRRVNARWGDSGLSWGRKVPEHLTA